ncbi:MAG: hypothetical protein ACK5Z2_15905 [Bacteroidota bacterium]|jgi:hypothetical protein
MQDETLITLKDILIPALSIIVAGGSVYLSHRQMRLQIKKNMRVRHIERIRDEISEFLGYFFIINMTTDKTTLDKSFKENVIRNFTRINLLIDSRKPKQKELIEKIENGLGTFDSKTLDSKAISGFIHLVTEAAEAAIQELEDEI